MIERQALERAGRRVAGAETKSSQRRALRIALERPGVPLTYGTTTTCSHRRQRARDLGRAAARQSCVLPP